MSDSEDSATNTTPMVERPPVKTPVCYSINQVAVLQNLGNNTFASSYEAYEFLQKIINLHKIPDSTKINRLPTPWREKFKSISRDENDYLYVDERLVIPKALRPIIMRSLHYGHPGRDSMLETVAWRVSGGQHCTGKLSDWPNSASNSPITVRA